MIAGLRERRAAKDELTPPQRASLEPRLPSVNLLPASVHDSIVAARTRRIAISLGTLIVAGTAGLWLLQGESVTSAETAVAAEQAHAAELEAKVKRLQPIQVLHNQISQQEEFVSTALSSSVQASVVLDRVLAIASPGSTMTAVSVDYQGVPQPQPGRDLRTQLNGCPTSDPFANDITVGCATFTGKTKSRAEVVNVLNRAESDPWLIGPFLSSTTSADDGVTFSGTSGIGIDALVTPLTVEQIEALLNPPKPATTEDQEEEAGE